MCIRDSPKVERVYYPGLDSSPYKALTKELFVEGRCGGMLSADIVNGEAGASTLIKECSTIKFVQMCIRDRNRSGRAKRQAPLSAGFPWNR